jgi:tetratricopeptide (TPR) repeat protein
LPEAEQHFRAVLALDPNYLNARRNLARLLTRQNRWADALPELLAGRRNDKPDPDFERAIAEAYMRLGRPKEAIPYLEATARLKPSPELHLGIAELQIQNGEIKGALSHFESALKLKPASSETLCKVAWIQATSEDPNIRDGRHAVEYGERACALTGNQVGPFLMALSAAYAEAGRFDDALKTAEKARSIAERSNNAALVQKMDVLLENFRQHKPYREKLAQG